ncbi:ABC transporter permease [Salinibacillus xinjiangensis]|uniref:ABC transporter permease n=1 Tax=Salinibacillus xinjiangensis TaxID=1229268 RepID=A0A6G1X7Q2_9BACI|nr:ABC transporter permease [Salinibacillus xinjiangensis]MRG86936.1 ABC transporter permease [Salinibacillus xinjiangensis]
MFNPNQLWKKRIARHAKETGRYLRLMFNDHLAFALLFFIAAFAYFYQQWLETIPDEFPADWLIAVILGFFVTRSPIRTLLVEADTFFLLPAEHKMGPYFQKGFWYSFMIQLYLLALSLAALAPLYLTVISEDGKSLIWLGVILIIFKIWNLFATWWMLKERDAKSRQMDVAIRAVLNILTLFFLLQGNAYLFASISTILFVSYLIYTYQSVGKKLGIAWDLLIEKEEASMQAFYRVANMFTDVPHLKKKAKKRHFLVHLLINSIPFRQDQTFQYLYRITFVRSSDYLGMYVRLLLIAIFLIFWVPIVWFKLVFAVLFIYLSGFQLMTLWNHHRTIDWIDLYPVTKKVRKQALLQFLLMIMLVKTAILGIFILIAASWQEMLLLWGIGGVFSYLFVQMYVKNRLDKRKVS